jgi:hypothetical protein
VVRTLIEPGKVREALAELPEGRVSNGSAFATCYVCQPFKYLNCLRYSERIATLAEFVLLARCHRFCSNHHIISPPQTFIVDKCHYVIYRRF